VTAAHPAEGLAAHLRDVFPPGPRPKAVVIAGSGLGGFARQVEAVHSVSYADLPGVGASTVAGHAGRLILGTSAPSGGGASVPLLVLSGRRHIYEGISAQDSVVLLQAAILAFGCKTVLLSNAAGGLNPLLQVGDLMMISDHINLMNRNPLIGANEERLGPRFPDLCDIYSRRLRGLARRAADDLGVTLREGVYIGGLGPSYETRAEVAMLRHIFKGDCAGMSTVLEAIAASHLGAEVLGISFVSNTLAVPSITTHEEVMENSRQVEGTFSRLVARVLELID
jgi:purine-nucleoside phosphorylase